MFRFPKHGIPEFSKLGRDELASAWFIRLKESEATAGSSSAGAVSVMNDGAASFHWLVPDENEPQHGNLVWACAPETLAAWHARNNAHHSAVNNDARRVNHWSLGIELVNVQDEDDNDRFSDWQVEVTANIVRYCWAKYPNLRHVVSHARLDPERRRDPGEQFPWERFKNLVLMPPNPAAPFAELTAGVINAANTSSNNGNSELSGLEEEDYRDFEV